MARSSPLTVLVTPRWLAMHVLAIAALVVCVVAGFWQLDRAETVEARAGVEAPELDVDPVPLAELTSAGEVLATSAVGETVTITGEYAPAGEQILVADRLHNGQEGYWVVDALLIEQAEPIEEAPGQPAAAVVVRGWVPDTTAASIAAPSGEVTVVGFVQAPEQGAARNPQAQDVDERVISALSDEILADLFPYELHPGYVIAGAQDPPNAAGMEFAQPQPEGGNSWRNLAYAGQWWIFGAFAVFMWWKIARDAVVDRREQASQSRVGQPDTVDSCPAP